MNQLEEEERVLFDGGPPEKLQAWLGLIQQQRPHVVRRALVAIALGWVPLLLLSAWRGQLWWQDSADTFLGDLGAHARFLIAAPALILAETICLPRLTAMAIEFWHGGLVSSADRSQYAATVHSTRRLMTSKLAEGLTIVLAYCAVGALAVQKTGGTVPRWFGSSGVHGIAHLEPAGWWAALVSVPLLLTLILGWMWRLMLWTRFVWLMSKLQLRLIPAHPDHAAGLGFLSFSLRAFTPLGFVIGLLAAGPMFNQVMHQGVSPLDFKFAIAGTVVFSTLVLAAPLMFFSNRLLAAQRHGLFTYGSLALRLGRQFEKKWFASEHTVDKESLAVPDFSATTDLYSITANVYAMRALPVDLRSLAALLIATLVPFVPLALMVAPLSVILEKVAAALL